ncbi:peroxidase 43 [Rhodamnia argentea]|uniref:Peroxidase n=1 Tax=Rhodamnia argentea TaxID=178133 RepID=A0A8B8QC54_9MYRT|nr:peroxidase 43 [Rhodamnia argentea]
MLRTMSMNRRPASNNVVATAIVAALVLVAHVVGLSESEGRQPQNLRVGFYSNSCPLAESIVRAVVKEAVFSVPQNAAVLLRVHFHDCFVEGCDGSILIDNGDSSERHAGAHAGVGGFEIIEAAKARLETTCPGVVSCADIVAMAARDAVFLSDGPFYEVETGRRDGRVSNWTLAADMPDVNDSIRTLKSKFIQKGLKDKDLVLLSAAHTIGTTACFFMGTRLYHFNSTSGSDPAIDPRFLPVLKSICPPGVDVNVRLALDAVTEFVFDDQILRNIKRGFAVISSDARLYDNGHTRQIVDLYTQNGTSSKHGKPLSFKADFAASMVKMGRIGVKTGSEGEIRRVCSSFN